LADPEESPANGPRPPPGPSTIVLFISGSIARADVPGLCERVRRSLEATDAHVVVCDVKAIVDPDAVAVDALARVALTARRLGSRIRLRHACGELEDLLDLAGLCDVVPLAEALRLEPREQPEEREQDRGVEEEADPDDPTG
jgi:ABC-type transporter Mla MlaB component